MKRRAQIRLLAAVIFLMTSEVWAGPYIPAGDLVLRHDIQRLADAGVIKGPISTWPLAWGPIVADLANSDASDMHPSIVASLVRVRERADWETRSNELTFNAKLGVVEKPTRVRSFQDTPRGKIDVAAGAGWTGDWFNVELTTTV